jgi:MerR family transcriptional regulator, mercuric resistance operon regulatory protein
MVQSQGLQAISIGKLAASAGVGVETIRFYQRRGLLKVPSRAGAMRRYGPDDVRRLRFIRQAQGAGFTLHEIGELLELDAGADRSRARDLARERIAALDSKIAELERYRLNLRRLERECSHQGDGPCPILASFDI